MRSVNDVRKNTVLYGSMLNFKKCTSELYVMKGDVNLNLFPNF